MKTDLKLKQRFPFYIKKIKKALKNQNTREIQKLIRKKNIKELEIVKKMDLDRLAPIVLCHSIAESTLEEIQKFPIHTCFDMSNFMVDYDKWGKILATSKAVKKNINNHLQDICRIIRGERKQVEKVHENVNVSEDEEDIAIEQQEEWHSEEEERFEDTAPKRKNRRGQQARRAIWEKKYGEKAKHIVDLKEEKTKKPKEKKKEQVDNSKNIVVPVENLHPSWQAKKLAKEQQQAQMSTVKATKITFED